jgi:hypothetical protein|tara:strand:+ start:563 stop:874 length:312 start_codon:yes stop_codon:yes gene_type:complete
MTKKEIKFRDPVVERVCDKFVTRSDVGYKKYGKTLHDERTGKHKDLLGYLNDIQEELMDAILYIQAAREELKDQAVIDAVSSAQLDWHDKNTGLPYYVTDVSS